jgi:tetrahedral aminopeptidase
VLLEQLSNAMGVSGTEGPVRKLIVEAVRGQVDSLRIDTIGNVFVIKQATGQDAVRVMLAAHMDEVGFMITEIAKSGMLKFQAVGGLDPRVLPGKAVVVGPERIPGVIGLKPPHVLAGQTGEAISVEAMLIDIGAEDEDQAKARIKIGDYATFTTRFGRLGGEVETDQRRGRVKGKALDDRVGCAVLVEILKERYPVEIVGVFTVQEEVGLRGARVAAYAVEPEVAIVLECTAADDLPRQDKEPGFPRLGSGPALTIMDRSFITNQPLLDLLVETAKAENIPYQFKRPGVGGTDAGAIHQARAGVPSITLAVPCRYIHAPAGIIDLEDFGGTIELVRATLRRLPQVMPRLRPGDSP